MPEVLEHSEAIVAACLVEAPHEAAVETAERRARQDLRRQIGRLERSLGELFASAFPRRGFEWNVGAVGGPRVLSTGELERVRDALALRLGDARVELARQADVEEDNRARLEAMIAAPEKHRWLEISRREVGEPGCGSYRSRPRLGILGMLFGWWRIRLSSGCPLVKGLRPPAPRARRGADGEEAAQAAAARRAGERRAGGQAQAGPRPPQADRGGAPARALGLVPAG